MIPKIIHYCWFGGNEKPEIVKNCITSWRKFCPDYEIIEWNETNYDINSNPFTKTAYENKKWAFVSDFARLELLCKYGGFYLDSDVEILCNGVLDQYRMYQNVFPFETERSINSGLMFGAEAGSSLCQELLAPYLERVYDKKNEVINSMMNKPVLIRELPGLKWDGKEQILRSTCIMGIEQYGKMMHHHGMRSWCDSLPKYKVSKDNRLKQILRNPDIFAKMESNKFLCRFVPIYEFLVYDLLDLGPLYYFRRLILKLRNKVE